MLVGAALIAAALVSMPLGGSLPGVGIGLTVFFVGYFVYNSPYYAPFPDLVPGEMRGRSQGAPPRRHPAAEQDEGRREAVVVAAWRLAEGLAPYVREGPEAAGVEPPERSARRSSTATYARPWG